MAPLEKAEMDALIARILQRFSGTPYACSSLIQLTNGTTNFVFRGTLTHPIEGGAAPTAATTVIVKHSTSFAALNKDLPIDIYRCVIEEFMLNALQDFHPSVSNIRVPRLYFFDEETSTQILEDITGVVDLKTVIVAPMTTGLLSESFMNHIGYTLGSWLRDFHSWTSAPSQSNLCAKIENNKAIRQLKYDITFGSFIEVLEQFLEVLGHNKEILKNIKDMATKDLQIEATEELEGWGIIHGDFWTGNVLLPETKQPLAETKLFVNDWEFAQFGHRACDIGQMIGDLYERKHFNGVSATIWAIDAFIEGYGAISEEMAFRVAVYTGLHLITWVKRGPPIHMRPAWASRERAVGAVELGMTFILKARDKDKQWFESSVLAGMFR
ncbi:kinase-like domain-containing protein [Xylogone sp. PMI_703]|nr:kinase-like domain-containing protein [Xylogone sp. PMI_703]